MRRFLYFFGFTLFVCLAPMTKAASSDAAETVTAFHNSLLSKLASLSGQSDLERYDAIQDTLDDAFNYKVMIRTVTGRYWRKAPVQEQDQVLQAFRDVSIATYADQYAGLTEGKFETLGSRDGPRGLQLVDTKLKTPSREELFTYVLREQDMAWQIIDVLLDGGKISELARKASEYASPLRDGGLIGLTATLENQKTQLLNN